MQSRLVTLTIPVDLDLTQIVTGFVEKACSAFGLAKRECYALTLAAEEVFAFLSHATLPDNDIQIMCKSGGYYVEMAFQLKSGMLPLEAFNLTRGAVPDDMEGAAQLGLILAARTVDRLYVDRIGEDTFLLRFVMEKRYPSVKQEAPLELSGRFHVRDADPTMLKELSARIRHSYGNSVNSFLTVPGKLIDMVASGDYDALALINERGQVGGGMVFRRNRQMSEAYGPFVFLQEAGLSQMLVEGMLEKLGRTKDALCLVIMEPTLQTPLEYFEPLQGGAVYRQLAEDDGARVFVHPCFKDLVKKFYTDLALPRMIQDMTYTGEELVQCSAIATAIDRQSKRGTLTLLWAGQNLEENLRAHVDLLQSQNIGDIRFRMELGSAEEAMMAPMVMSAGFEPSMILPWAGQGDVVIFSYRGRK
ncbi:ATP-binding protein [Candidatus Formimonas warabiya]|uniref:Uncharacterized protein n=1 Tax=Formimonas warabiya TaxID=1761012 RepID=A0A3G1L050_FORW1|nr:ATP-binding protein [Candidatus Formimonas warabiya]ATW27855.1 hypothetical protein DCMF_26635 [Candidatus Formimonas warabiya]